MRPSASSIFCCNQRSADSLGGLPADGLLFSVHHPGDSGQSGERHFAEGYATVLLVFGLKGAGKVLVTFIGNNKSLFTDSSKTRKPF